MRDDQLSISVIVPVLNEIGIIQPFLRQLRERAAGAEIIVADGGSSDQTAEIAAGFCDQLIRSERGRASQMNAGARIASGDILWFLHVDVEPPPGCLDEIARVISNPRVAGGYFRIRLPQARFVYRLTDSFAHYAGLVMRMRCGDHGLFCRKKDFIGLGGFPDVPLMEDVEFFRMLLRRGRMVAIKERLVASTRRYEAVGPRRLTLAYGLIATLYVLKVPMSVLTAIYQRMCSQRFDTEVPQSRAGQSNE